MGLHSEAALNMKITDLSKQLNLYLNHFPKHEKYGLCQQIRNCLYEMYGLVIESQKRYHKKTTLSNLDIKHEQLRWFCFLANELGYFCYTNGKSEPDGYKRYLVVSAMVDEVGRMIGGWIQQNRIQEAS